MDSINSTNHTQHIEWKNTFQAFCSAKHSQKHSTVAGAHMEHTHMHAHTHTHAHIHTHTHTHTHTHHPTLNASSLPELWLGEGWRRLLFSNRSSEDEETCVEWSPAPKGPATQHHTVRVSSTQVDTSSSNTTPIYCKATAPHDAHYVCITCEYSSTHQPIQCFKVQYTPTYTVL